MNSDYNVSREIVIDLIDVMWKLLMQWKAILLVCIAIALVVPGAKLLKDTQEYKIALKEEQTAKDDALKPASDRIDSALKLLPSDQRDDVLFVVQQKEMIDAQKNYLNESILLNTDPTDVRQLSIKYLFKSDVGTDMRTLADAYSTCLRRNDFLKSLGSIISPNTKLEYIDELINTENEDILAGDSESAVYTVTITLPDDVDADSIVSLFDSAIYSLHEELSVAIGDHNIARANVEDLSAFSKDIVERRANLTYTINNLTSSLNNAKGGLNAEQQAAYESIVAINSVSDADQDNNVVANPLKPVFSKKYAVLGFLLGAFLYTVLYVVIIILKKPVTSARVAHGYTGTRLLGEVYLTKHHSGFRWLLTSDLIAKWRYKEKLDANGQINALAATVDAVCSHHNTDNLAMMLCSVNDGFSGILDMIVKSCSSEDTKKRVTLINADHIDEKVLATAENAIYVLCNNSTVDSLNNLSSLVNDYDVTVLGTVYLEEL